MKPILGIDLGTTKCVACVRLGEECVDIEPKDAQQAMLPSLFIHLKSGRNVVGVEAAQSFGAVAQFKHDVIRNVKRYMRQDAPVGDRPARKFRSGGREFSPAEIAAAFLKELRDAAERQTPRLKTHKAAKGLDWENWLDGAVITVPAYFDPLEREATRRAAALAGFKPDSVHLLNEPVAAALAAGIHKASERELVLVVDLGGGTCDFTLLKSDNAAAGGLKEVGLFGDNHFGGLEWDCDIAEIVRRDSPLGKSVPHLLGDDGLPDYVEFGDLFENAEKAKRDLCLNRTQSAGRVEFGVNGTRTACMISRDQFDAVSNGHAEYCGRLGDLLLDRVDPLELGWRAGRRLKWQDLDRVLLVGGGSQIPHVREVLQQRWGKKPEVPSGAQMAIGRGAAVYGQLIAAGNTLDGVGRPRSLHDIGIMADPDAPRQTLWQRMTGMFRGRSGTNGKVPHAPVFVQMIPRNSLLPKRVCYRFPFSTPDPEEVFFEVCILKHSRGAPHGAPHQLEIVKLDLKKSGRARQEDVLRVWMSFDEYQKFDLKARMGDQEEGFGKDKRDFDETEPLPPEA